MRIKKGSKRFRVILSKKVTSIISPNISKYAELTGTIIGSEAAGILNSMWGLSYLHNNLRTFIFKLHNNTLGLNNRVAHFVRGHPNTCTFCDLTNEPEENIESIGHLFFECRHVENLISSYYGWIFSQEQRFVTRTEYFVRFDMECERKNKTLLLLNVLVKNYIWNCKLRFCLPSIDQLKKFVAEEVSRIGGQCGSVREMFLQSQLFADKNEIRF